MWENNNFKLKGLEALKEHFKNSKFPCEMDHYLPVVFSPARDGRQLTEPQPIVGQKQQLPMILGLPMKSTDLESKNNKGDADQEEEGDTTAFAAETAATWVMMTETAAMAAE